MSKVYTKVDKMDGTCNNLGLSFCSVESIYGDEYIVGRIHSFCLALFICMHIHRFLNLAGV